MTIHIRGIYSTALTHRFHSAGWTVTHPSEPIVKRFDAPFSRQEPKAWITDGADRLGIGISGDPDTFDDVLDVCRSVGRDTFVCSDPTPIGALFVGRVDRTAGGGAIVTLPDDREGYLPFAAIDEFVSEGDRVRVQVAEPVPPWGQDRPVLRGTIRAPGTLCSVEAGANKPVIGAPDRETAGLTDILDVDMPEGWGIHWHSEAAGVEIEAMRTGLELVRERVDRITNASSNPVVAPETDDGAVPRTVARPLEGTWIRFGGESRSTLDVDRRTIVPTMTGHHRIKVIGDAAGSAVDFFERIARPDGSDSFPFEAVTETFGPTIDDEIAIEHGKPDGTTIVLGHGTVVDRDSESDQIRVEREMRAGGTYDGLGVSKEDGDVATTVLAEGRWWYPTVYRSEDGAVKGTYVNICTPIEIFPEAVRYIDLYVDVIKHPDGTTEIVDDAELASHETTGTVSSGLAEQARSVAESIRRAFEE